MNNTSDHDLLIEINTKVTLFNDSFIKHCEEDAVAFSSLEKSMKAAHRRIDWLLGSGILTIICLIIAVVVRVQ